MPGPKFDPTFNLGHVLTVLALLAAGFSAYYAQTAKTETLRNTVETQLLLIKRNSLRIDRQEDMYRQDMRELRSQINEVLKAVKDNSHDD